MKVFISIDIEGISGVSRDAQTTHGSADWQEARGLMRADLDAALQGCLDAGATEIVICDAHDHSDNLDTAGLPPQATLISGAQFGLSMMTGVDAGFDAAVLIGYHAMAGTAEAVLCHTYMDEVHRVTVLAPDGEYETGELGLNAGVAGAFGVPVVFASGDDKLAAEAQVLLPDIGVAVVKEGLAREAARLLTPELAQGRIREGVAQALSAQARPAPLAWDGRGLRVSFDQVQWCDGAATCPGTRRLDGYSLEITGERWLDVFATFLACIALAVG